jgi:hypothetical protein
LSPDTNDSLLTSPPTNGSAAFNNEGSGDSSSEDEPLTRRLPTKKLSTKVEQPAAPAWRAGFMEKVNALRKHLRWLAHTLFPIEKQAGLAASLGISPSSLSTFLTGNRKCGGEMSVQQLDHARRDMQRRLVAARLPGTMPMWSPSLKLQLVNLDLVIHFHLLHRRRPPQPRPCSLTLAHQSPSSLSTLPKRQAAKGV